MKSLILFGLLVTVAVSQNTDEENISQTLLSNGFNETTLKQPKTWLVGGQNVTAGQIKYIGTLVDRYYAAGSVVILDKDWVITAASNVAKIHPKTTQIRVGSLFSESGGVLHDCKSFFIHPHYKGGWEYDVALIKLKQSLKYDHHISKIGLSTKLPKNHEYTIVSGFGMDSEPSKIGYLKMALLPFLDYNSCKKKYQNFHDFTSFNYCTNGKHIGPCAYDWGCPLVYNGKLIGVFAGSYECAGKTFPPVFSDIPKLRGWITKTMKQNQ